MSQLATPVKRHSSAGISQTDAYGILQVGVRTPTGQGRLPGQWLFLGVCVKIHADFELPAPAAGLRGRCL